MNFAKKTIAKIFIIAGLFAATVQPTDAQCSTDCRNKNGGCVTISSQSGSSTYCDTTEMCNDCCGAIAASSVLTN